MHSVRLCCAALAALLGIVTSAAGQSASLAGRVTDPQGGAVIGVVPL